MTTYTSQPDETNGVDTFIDSAFPTTNFVTAADVRAGEDNTSGAEVCRILIKFDLSSIPADAIVSSAVLSLWQSSERSGNTRTFRVFRQKRDWVESQATWNIYKTSNNWQTAGGFGADDCEQTDIGSLSMTGTEGAGEKQFNLTASAIQEMISGAFVNNGFLIKTDTESDDMQLFRSATDGTSSLRPKLTVTYEVGGKSFFFVLRSLM
jgi:hypothetical protein